MKRDGRALAHNTLEETRILAAKRMAEGEHPEAVAASFGMNRSWAVDRDKSVTVARINLSPIERPK